MVEQDGGKSRFIGGIDEVDFVTDKDGEV